MKRFTDRLALGCLVSFPVTAILTGGVGQAFSLMLISIICTAGVGLVFWIPVWWFVGFSLESLYRMATGKPLPKPEPISNPTRLPSRDFAALKSYVAEALTAGLNVDEITRRLQQNGWRHADIESAHQSVISSISTKRRRMT